MNHSIGWKADHSRGSKYALAISLTYQSPERTLTDEEVEGYDKQILESLKQRLGAELRQ